MTKAEIKSLIARLTHENTTEKEEAEILNAIVDAMPEGEVLSAYDTRNLPIELTEEQYFALLAAPSIVTDEDAYPLLRIPLYPKSLADAFEGEINPGCIWGEGVLISGNVDAGSFVGLVTTTSGYHALERLEI